MLDVTHYHILPEDTKVTSNTRTASVLESFIHLLKWDKHSTEYVKCNVPTRTQEAVSCLGSPTRQTWVLVLIQHLVSVLPWATLPDYPI